MGWGGGGVFEVIRRHFSHAVVCLATVGIALHVGDKQCTSCCESFLPEQVLIVKPAAQHLQPWPSSRESEAFPVLDPSI